MNQIEVSIVIPVYNSSQTIAELFTRIDSFFAGNGKKYELILVDDGSMDSSWREIEKLKKENPEKIIAIKFVKNFGQQNALLCGFNYCSGGVVITMDDDLQHPPEEMEKLLSKYNDTDSDIIYGVPKNKQHSVIRNLGSDFVSKTSEYSSTNTTKGSSFRLIKREIIEEIKNKHHYNFLFLDAAINQFTGRIDYIFVEHHARKAGKSGYTLKKLISLYFNILVNYSAAPLRVMTYGGLFASIISFLIGTHFIYKKIIHNVPLGYTSLIVSILFSTGLILFCLGIIGQYLYKLFQLQNQKPPYFIKHILK